MRHLDRDATLRRPTVWQWLAALAVLASGLGVAVRSGGVAALWPLLGLALWWMARGAPSLSNPPAPDLALGIALIPGIAAAATAATPRRLLARGASPCVLAMAVAALSGVIAAAAGGPPPRMPGWTGQLYWWSSLSTAAVAAAACAAAVRAMSARRT